MICSRFVVLQHPTVGSGSGRLAAFWANLAVTCHISVCPFTQLVRLKGLCQRNSANVPEGPVSKPCMTCLETAFSPRAAHSLISIQCECHIFMGTAVTLPWPLECTTKPCNARVTTFSLITNLLDDAIVISGGARQQAKGLLPRRFQRFGKGILVGPCILGVCIQICTLSGVKDL